MADVEAELQELKKDNRRRARMLAGICLIGTLILLEINLPTPGEHAAQTADYTKAVFGLMACFCIWLIGRLLVMARHAVDLECLCVSLELETKENQHNLNKAWMKSTPRN